MYIHLNGVKIYAYHGVLPQENKVGAEYILNLTLKTDFSRASQMDDLTYTINYAEVYDIVAAEMAVPSRLLEHVAGRIIRSLRARFPLIEGGTVTVAKLTPPFKCEMTAVSVTIKF